MECGLNVGWNWCATVLVGIGVFELDGVVHVGLDDCWRFPRSSLLGPFVLFGTKWNTSTTKSQRMRAGIPSVRKAASREMISASVEPCETEVCVLHIQLVGTNVWFPKMHRTPPDVNCESSRSPAKSESWKIQVYTIVLCFPHNDIVGTHLCDERTRSNAPSVCHKLLSIGDPTSKFIHRPWNVRSPNSSQIKTFESNL